MELIKNNRYYPYIILIASIIAQLCLGSIYAWSVFQTALFENDPYHWSKFATQIPFSVAIFTNPLAMIPGGRWQDKVGPKKVSTVGGLLFGLGYLLAGLIDVLNLNEFWGVIWLSLTYGVVSGIGLGFVYVCPIATLVKWFPKRKGLTVGIAVAGFGLGSFFFISLEDLLISLTPNGSVGFAFVTLGLIYLSLVTTAAQFFSNPPSVDEKKVPIDHDIKKDKSLLLLPEFWLLWLAFVFAASAGIMTIGNVKTFVQQQLQLSSDSLTALEIASIATSLGGLIAVFNAIGRISLGSISDRLGRSSTLIMIFFLLGTTMIVINYQYSVLSLLICVCLIGFSYGGNFSIFPSKIADLYGSDGIGTNYSLLFTSVSVAGLLGPFIAGVFSYNIAFLVAGILSFLAIFLVIFSDILVTKQHRISAKL